MPFAASSPPRVGAGRERALLHRVRSGMLRYGAAN